MHAVLARKAPGPVIDLHHKKIEGMIWFADYLEQPIVEINDDSVFAIIVQTAIDTHGLSAKDLASRFGVNQTTISRWKAGKNAPQPIARPVIVSWIGKKMRAEAKALQEQTEF